MTVSTRSLTMLADALRRAPPRTPGFPLTNPVI
jgi:hypothetical protein